MIFLSWGELHGALTHIPVAFLLGVAVFESGAVLFRKPEWRLVSFWLLVGAVAVAVPSLITGWVTGGTLGFSGSTARAPSVFMTHRLFAFTTSGLATVLLLWRVRVKDRLSRRALGASLFLSLLIAVCVSYTGFLGGRMVFGNSITPTGEEAEKPEPDASAWKTIADGATVERGRVLFAKLPCSSCHRMEGKGGISGPDLTHEARRHSEVAWHIAHLKDPGKMRPNSDMPPFDSLPPRDLEALASYLASRK